MRINTNLAALNTHRLMGQTNDAIAKSIGRLSSGFRINRAGDDAAGLAIANKFQADIRSLRVAQQNTTEATSMLQVAEGNATTISTILGRMKELATQASSYNSNSQLTTLNNEFSELKGEIDRIVDAADYQGVKLLDGSFNGTFQIGARNAADNQLAISLASGTSTVSGQFADGGDLGTITWGSNALLSGLADGTYSIVANGTTGTAGGHAVSSKLTDGGGLTGVTITDSEVANMADATYTMTAAKSGGNLTFTLSNGTDTWTASVADNATNAAISFHVDPADSGSNVFATFEVTDASAFDETTFGSQTLFQSSTTAGTPGQLTFEIQDAGATVIATATETLPASGTVSFDLADSSGSLARFSIDAATFDAAAFASQNFLTVDSANPVTTGLSTTDLALDAVDLTSAGNSQAALDSIDSAIDMVNSFLGTIGATQNRLDYAATNIATTVENYSASESAIRDADMAFEMTTFTRNQIMQQAAMAMLAQANAAPQGVLRLLG